jgi:isopentenyl-diphosphate delta-isomerase
MFNNQKEAQIPIILVNHRGEKIGLSTKQEAHEKGLLHLAFSVFIRHEKTGKILLQQRASGKYHAPDLWANACCGHPGLISEDVLESAKLRLEEELGIRASLKIKGQFTYFHQFKPNLFEHEYDFVLEGIIGDQDILFNSQEVQAFKWMDQQEVLKDLLQHPERYAPWFFMAINTYIA